MKKLKDYLQTNNLPIIYSDLDETLCDFFAGADKTLLKFHYPKWQDQYWKQFSSEEADHKRWEIINKEPNFWNNLNWLKDGQLLWSFIVPYSPHILSHATERYPGSKEQKESWIKEYLGINTHERIHLVKHRSDKQLFAVDNLKNANLLIDDYAKNCDDFIKHGGLAIQHKSAKETIVELKKMGFT